MLFELFEGEWWEMTSVQHIVEADVELGYNAEGADDADASI